MTECMYVCMCVGVYVTECMYVYQCCMCVVLCCGVPVSKIGGYVIVLKVDMPATKCVYTYFHNCIISYEWGTNTMEMHALTYKRCHKIPEPMPCCGVANVIMPIR